MDLLQAINIVIRASTKPAINDIDDQSQDANLARRTIREVRTEILSHGWRFNTRKLTLSVDTDGRVPVPSTYLSVKFSTDNDRFVVQEREEDGALFVYDQDTEDWHNAEMKDVIIIFDKGTDPTTEDAQFRLLPAKIARYIAYKAASEFFQEINGVENGGLLGRAVRAHASWVNTQEFTSMHGVTGFSAIKAAGHGGGSGTFDARTQSHV